MAENEKVTQEEIEETTADTVEEVVEEAPKKSETELLKEQLDTLNDKLLRNAAEFDNFKKRTIREKEDFYKMAVCETVAPFLLVLDNLDRAIDAAAACDNNVLEGIKMIKKQFDDTLLNMGVTPIEAVGKEFDPEKHNAVMTEESDSPENTVIEEFQKGYSYKDKVIRHSMVKVSN